jgi:hypothetical protein
MPDDSSPIGRFGWCLCGTYTGASPSASTDTTGTTGTNASTS